MIFESTDWLDPWVFAGKGMEEGEVENAREFGEILGWLPLEHGR